MAILFPGELTTASRYAGSGHAGASYIQHGVDEETIIGGDAARVARAARQRKIDLLSQDVRQFMPSIHHAPP